MMRLFRGEGLPHVRMLKGHAGWRLDPAVEADFKDFPSLLRGSCLHWLAGREKGREGKEELQTETSPRTSPCARLVPSLFLLLPIYPPVPSQDFVGEVMSSGLAFLLGLSFFSSLPFLG